MLTAMNWLAPANTMKEKDKVSIRLSPAPFESIPNAIAIEKYPINKGMLAFIPSFIFSFLLLSVLFIKSPCWYQKIAVNAITTI